MGMRREKGCGCGCGVWVWVVSLGGRDDEIMVRSQ